MKKDKRIIMVSLMLAGSLSIMGCKGSDYKKGVEDQETGKYKEAVEMYKSIKNYGDYKDTADRIKSCEAMIDAITQYDASKSALIEKNKNLEFGARPLRGIINREIVDKLSDELLKGEIKIGDKLKVECKDESLKFSHQ